MQVDISFETAGAIMNGQGENVIAEFMDEWAQTMGDVAVTELQMVSWGTFMRPTGNWARHIQTDIRGDDVVVHDSRLVYGPWLEGTSRRNRSTHFKGYSLFRKRAQALEARAEQIGQSIADGYIRRLEA